MRQVERRKRAPRTSTIAVAVQRVWARRVLFDQSTHSTTSPGIIVGVDIDRKGRLLMWGEHGQCWSFDFVDWFRDDEVDNLTLVEQVDSLIADTCRRA